MKNWLSAHIYYSEPFEKILIEAVKPFFESIQEQFQSDGYFFIRYWERGPHIRIRIKDDPDILEQSIKPFLESWFSDYMSHSASKRTEPDWLKKQSEADQWYPNNSIQFIKYDPEIKRYGGEHTIKLSEKHFQHSSDVVLKLIEANKKWTYERALGAALQLHLSFAYAIGLDISQTQQFYNRVYSHWLPRAYNVVIAKSDEEKKEKPKKIIEAFKKTYSNEKKILIPFMNSFWDILLTENKIDYKWLYDWIQNVKEIDKQFRNEQNDGNLEAPFQIQLPKSEGKIGRNMLERWSIYYSFVHMTNNRLGILNRDEGYLGYLLSEGLKNEK